MFGSIKAVCQSKLQRQEKKLQLLWLRKNKLLPNCITNLSSKELSLEEKFVLRNGLKFGILPKSIDQMKLKATIESKVNSCTKETDILPGVKFRDDVKMATTLFFNSANNLCRSRKHRVQHNILRKLSDDKTIKLCRLDKGNGVCIMDTSDYYKKLDIIVDDKSKFKEVPFDLTTGKISTCKVAPYMG